jgi:hypothetical protein
MALADTHAADDGQSRPSRFDDYETRTDEMQAVIDGFVDELLTDARDAVASDQFQRWLDAQSQFTDYSVRNTLLIRAQMPDATHVAGYNTWQDLGRQVQEGESAIWIWSPIIAKQCPSCGNAPSYHERDHVDCTGHEDGNPDEWRRGAVGFKPTSVFDISQTDGKPLPDLDTETVGDSDGLVDDILAAADRLDLDASVVPPDDWDHPDSWRGACEHRDPISLRPVVEAKDRDNRADLARTLIHEYAHALLHDDIDDEDERSRREVEAESVAYIVAKYYDLDPSNSAFYLAGWDDDCDDTIQDRLTRISNTAETIIDAVTPEAKRSLAQLENGGGK